MLKMSIKFLKLYICFLFFIISYNINSLPIGNDPEVSMNISEIIRYYKYPCENYEVITPDKYILSFQRIPYGVKSPKTNVSRPVVLLQHGLLDSAHTWVNNSPNESLGFILADNGYDVWLANSRGSTYSNKHVTLKENNPKFWEFSWDEMAYYDLPSFVNFALSKNGNASKLIYIGHSQGTEIAFARIPKDPVLKQKLRAFVALAPIAYLGNVEAGLRVLARFRKELEDLLELFGHGRILSNSPIVKFLAKTLCGKHGLPKICSEMIFLLAGSDFNNLNQSRLPVYISHTPAGTSMMNLMHYAQSVSTGKFQMYDYGIIGNLKHYGTRDPPLYSIIPTGLPTAVFSGGNDTLADSIDVNRLVSLLKPDLKLIKHINHYNHLDFVWGEDAYKLIYPDVLNFIKQYI